MEFKKFSAGYKSYGIDSTADVHVEYDEGVTNVNFYDEQFKTDWANPNSHHYYEYL